jgi:DNA polymerase
MAETLNKLREAAKSCRDCPLWQDATQTVFGAGSRQAKIMLIGEQPGDEEDRQGLPFVGPAGKLLDRALAAANVDREHVYITNAVKHFKWQLRGKRRMHKTPAQREVAACMQWLEREMAVLKPTVIVCLGATAARALLGSAFRVSTMRGQFIDSAHAKFVYATLHPSALLRVPGEQARHEAFDQFVDDLKLIHKAIKS